MSEEAYLVLVTWPDGTEGLLFPRPGNVPISTTEGQGLRDFELAVDHLKTFVAKQEEFLTTHWRIRLIRFTRHEVVCEYPRSAPTWCLPGQAENEGQ